MSEEVKNRAAGGQICRAVGGRTGGFITNIRKSHAARGQRNVKVCLEVFRFEQMTAIQVKTA
jgi:hypothetical protein